MTNTMQPPTCHAYLSGYLTQSLRAVPHILTRAGIVDDTPENYDSIIKLIQAEIERAHTAERDFSKNSNHYAS